jgi:hypothetical protein
MADIIVARALSRQIELAGKSIAAVIQFLKHILADVP